MTRAPALAITALVAACGAPEIPSATPPPPPAATAAPVAAPAPPSASPSVAPLPPAVLAPVTRAFTEVSLPGMASVASIHGRGARDVWLLGEDGVLVQHDGARVVKRHDRPCIPRDGQGDNSRYMSVLALPGVVRLFGVSLGGVDQRATLLDGGSWTCDSGGSTLPENVTGGGGVGLWLTCQWARSDCILSVEGAPDVPLPSRHADRTTPMLAGFWPLAPDDIWTALDDEPALLRYRGVSWRVLAPLGAWHVADLWPEPDGAAWLLLSDKPRDYHRVPGTRVARWDGRALQVLPAPAGFSANRVAAIGPREVWFVGDKRSVYQWDGQAFRRGEAPFEVGEVWAAPGAGLWITGDRDRKAVAARLPPLATGGVP